MSIRINTSTTKILENMVEDGLIDFCDIAQLAVDAGFRVSRLEMGVHEVYSLVDDEVLSQLEEKELDEIVEGLGVENFSQTKKDIELAVQILGKRMSLEMGFGWSWAHYIKNSL